MKMKRYVLHLLIGVLVGAGVGFNTQASERGSNQQTFDTWLQGEGRDMADLPEDFQREAYVQYLTLNVTRGWSDVDRDAFEKWITRPDIDKGYIEQSPADELVRAFKQDARRTFRQANQYAGDWTSLSESKDLLPSQLKGAFEAYVQQQRQNRDQREGASGYRQLRDIVMQAGRGPENDDIKLFEAWINDKPEFKQQGSFKFILQAYRDEVRDHLMKKYAGDPNDPNSRKVREWLNGKDFSELNLVRAMEPLVKQYIASLRAPQQPAIVKDSPAYGLFVNFIQGKRDQDETDFFSAWVLRDPARRKTMADLGDYTREYRRAVNEKLRNEYDRDPAAQAWLVNEANKNNVHYTTLREARNALENYLAMQRAAAPPAYKDVDYELWLAKPQAQDLRKMGLDDVALRMQYDQMQAPKPVSKPSNVGEPRRSPFGVGAYGPMGPMTRSMMSGSVSAPASQSRPSVSSHVQAPASLRIGQALTATEIGKEYGDQDNLKVNEDVFIVDDNDSLYGVFDGNGKSFASLAKSFGLQVNDPEFKRTLKENNRVVDWDTQLDPVDAARFVGKALLVDAKRELINAFKANSGDRRADDAAIREIFARVQKALVPLVVMGSGTTATIAHINQETRLLTIASVGDSPAVLCRANDDPQVVFTPTQVDKAFGNKDANIAQLVQITRVQLEPTDRALLLMSDGVSNVLKDKYSREDYRSLCSLNTRAPGAIDAFMEQVVKKRATEAFNADVALKRAQGVRDHKIAAKMDDSTLIVVPLNQ